MFSSERAEIELLELSLNKTIAEMFPLIKRNTRDKDNRFRF
jgi:hypothetical protein